MKYRKKGLHAEPESALEKKMKGTFKEINDLIDERMDLIYQWECPKCLHKRILLKLMVNDATGVITCPNCGHKETLSYLKRVK